MFQFDIPAAIRTPPVEEFVSVDSLLYMLRWWVGPLAVCCNEQARYCPSRYLTPGGQTLRRSTSISSVRQHGQGTRNHGGKYLD